MALSQDKGAASCCPEDEKLPLAKTFAYGLQHIRKRQLSAVCSQLDCPDNVDAHLN
ncbi:hypothetical protein D3C76_1598240 [compost metagenome]